MTRVFIIFVLCATTLNGTATTLHDQLCAFNFNWKKYYMQAPKEDARDFSGDRELIQAHLEAVLNVLRAAQVDALNPLQLQARYQMVLWLDEYRAAGNFPLNYYRAERIPVFIDELGTHCAVGYLMMMSGHDEMAQRISRADNYVWVKDLNDVGVPAWQEASGLSFEELALIQGAYDFYPENSYFLANRFETPQQPKCTTAYFGNSLVKNVWCRGDGKNGVLNGKWEQHWSVGIPWIEGHYTNGKRSGQWKEYYPGTTLLCRTERWFNDKLNGTRIRYDREGFVIEEIIFNEGVAVSKINYSLSDSVAYVRVPLDSNTVATTVYNSKGQLIAAGKEEVYNPSGLLWFQSIELTALNSAQITARDVNVTSNGLNAEGGYYQNNYFSNPSLVEYRKIGQWFYFVDTCGRYANQNYYRSIPLADALMKDYHHFGPQLYSSIAMFEIKPQLGYDSLHVTYENNRVIEFCAYGQTDYAHLHLDYYVTTYTPIIWYIYGGRQPQTAESATVKECGQYNRYGQREGEWKYYNEQGQMYKTEQYLIPQNEEETAGL